MVKADDLKTGDTMCVGGQCGEFVRLFGKRKAVCYRIFGSDETRLAYPGIVYRDERSNVRVERNMSWVRVEK